MMALLVHGLGCAARNRPPDLAVDPGVAGRVEVETLPDPAAKTPPLAGGRQLFLAPVPLETPLPAFPAVALADGMHPVVVVIRIVIGEQGNVLGVLDSPVAPYEAGSTALVFRAAVEEALRGWSYKPAIIRSFVGGEDINHDGRPDVDVVTQDTPVRSYLDLRFTFDVVDGRGQVRMRPGGTSQ
ncbi:MAG TPA: hypothetical protein VGV60_11080 [Candidatus Polarisedimenticolia bacterium]|nr:hypothetical protein [Candidatus Polarisedimenticolia bacterium]